MFMEDVFNVIQDNPEQFVVNIMAVITTVNDVWSVIAVSKVIKYIVSIGCLYCHNSQLLPLPQLSQLSQF